MRQALADFHTSLARIRLLADSIVASTGTALSDPKLLSLHETEQCGAVVLLSGCFEAFLKDLVRQFFNALSGLGLPFSGLPRKIRDGHFERGGRVLSEVAAAARTGRACRFGSGTREDVAPRLHSVSAPRGPYRIVWEAFADTQQNPGPKVVKEIANDLGVADFWRFVSRSSGNPARWSDTALESKLGDLVMKRNECAHTGKVSPVPTAVEVVEFVELLEVVGAGFVAALEGELAKHAGSVALRSRKMRPPRTRRASP
jgi:hypothetical protein